MNVQSDDSPENNLSQFGILPDMKVGKKRKKDPSIFLLPVGTIIKIRKSEIIIIIIIIISPQNLANLCHKTWPNVWVIFEILYVYMMDGHVL